MRCRKFDIITIVGDIGFAEAASQRSVIKGCDVARPTGGTFDDVNVGDTERLQLVNDIVILRLRIATGNAVGG